MLNGKVQNIYHLPPPCSCPANESGDPVNLRIPPTEKPTVSQVKVFNKKKIANAVLPPLNKMFYSDWAQGSAWL